MNQIIFQGNFLKLILIDDNFLELSFGGKKRSVNVFNQKTIDELLHALSIVENQSHTKGLIFASTKSVFVAGADIGELNHKFKNNEELEIFFGKANKAFNIIESLPYPSVAAINGFALGGGFELCLACDFRIMSSEASVGLPETKLGIIPGWGGTVRLPRLIGLGNALSWIISGEHKSPPQALADGAVDAVVKPKLLKEESLAALKSSANGNLNYHERRKQKQAPLTIDKTEEIEAIEFSRAFISSKIGANYPAPLAALDMISNTVKMSRDSAQKLEFETFCKLAQTSECRSLLGVFVSDQYISSIAKKFGTNSSKIVKHVTVLGAGIMGGGIAYQNSLKGFPVLMTDISDDSLVMGMKEVNKLLDKRVFNGRTSNQEAKNIISRITPTLDYQDMKKTSIVIEAVIENKKIKSIVLANIEKKLSIDAILVSNTSTISIDYLASHLDQPDKFCGMHFFNPVHAMPLVEIIRGKKTSEETIGLATSHAVKLGKKPIIVNDCPGFLVNRVLFPAIFAFDMMVVDGADFQQIDKVIESWGWPMGPAYLMDIVGLDTAISCFSSVTSGYPDRMKDVYDVSPTRLLFEANRFGQKNQKGYYMYESDAKGKPKKLMDDRVFKLLKPHINQRSSYSTEFNDESIFYRFMIPMCIEIALCLEEGIVGSPSEADMAIIYGLGFPVFRGGPFRWMDEIGLDTFCKLADEFIYLGNLYKPTLKMREMAKESVKYYNS